MGRAGVARDHDGLYTLVQEPLQNLQTVPFDRVRRLGAIGYPCGIAEVDGGFSRQPLVDGSGDSEPADAGIEYADRRRVHRRRTGTEIVAPTPPGSASSRRSPGKSAR